MKLSFTLSGIDASQAMLEELGRRALPVGMRSLMMSGERVMRRSKDEFCPVDTGALRASGQVRAETNGNVGEVQLSYSTDYAVYVHEINKHYRGGKSWKFLQQPLQEAVNDISRDLQAEYQNAFRQ